MRAWILGCVCAWCCTVPADAGNGWQGYINDKATDGSRYGYLVQTSTTSDSRLRLLCHSNGVFSLLIDPRLMPDANHKRIAIRVDQLDTIDVPLTPVKGIYAIDQQHSFFWQLIAQLAAGAVLNVDSGQRAHQYDLSGFTQTYHTHCGWAPGARQYRQHLRNYR